MHNEDTPSEGHDSKEVPVGSQTPSTVRNFERKPTPAKPAAEMTEEEKAIAYFSRHGRPKGAGVRQWDITTGLRITWNYEGLWLDFSTADGLGAAVHMDMIGPQGHPNSIVQKAINQWCTEFTEANKNA